MQSRGKDRQGACNGAELPAQGAVLFRFCRGRKLSGVPRAQEAARVLGESIDSSGKGQIAVRDGKVESRSQAAKP